MPELSVYWPTAVQESVAMQDTPMRPLTSAPVGLGVGAMDPNARTVDRITHGGAGSGNRSPAG